ncbi:lipid-binding SYLF domain-containing protein [Aureliella helgolandensis]|uniref:Ysc84 actin-binding domain-containing protein n=1 Tax=Aureliella helgolandensis TaxID=2527968 RepID=A0A518G9Y4_9BACT|nr:lipid-binding SYLF domain-containing protein [Aureliella helgolandensis]QDV25379.1 hypothetical protein Q31a_37050 [Aureliella helgolandensis]
MPSPLRMLALTALLVLSTRQLSAQYQQEETVRAAASVLTETMATPLNRIPQAMLANAHGVAIIPNVIKGSFIVGARHGRGLLFVREPNGVWHAPVFISLTGGNIGWQIGVQSSDIVLVFKTPRSIQGILSGKLTLGADAAAAAGPVGRESAVATDAQLKAEIYSYSRSRGLFAGVSIDGSVVQVDQVATGTYYRSPGPGLPVQVPASAQQLTEAIVSYTGQGAAAVPTPNEPSTGLAAQYGQTESEVLRLQLLQLTPELFDLLDPQWRAHLALPQSFQQPNANPQPAEIQAIVDRYAQVATDPQFQQLAVRPEFQSVYSLLRHYQQSFTENLPAIQLPPPPNVPQVLPQ